ncbi:LuxR family transcriptional regulator [Streptomyces sp. MA15]|uniref:helix-turn-helix transcriptional regulator n=1 Tax=Streptomyces sp. MA15 TaxID=3055061 RepID=UPI0025AF3A3E|nr:LuxR family transcriptional regulator [Streptomyces sp. MA15]MDN3266969.1 LuxR C-terminal-related transcriptional regulator [Streptomyces sp. MA15]
MTGYPTARQRLTAELLDALRTDGGVRVVTGEPGCGRTTFLDHAARLFRAGPVRHVRAGRVRELDDALRTAAVAGPLLVCVDDAHLWDAPSRAALARAAARVRRTGSRAGLLLTVAGHRPVDPEFADLPVLRLGPLTPGDAALLIREAADGAVDPGVRDELITAAEGNPALLLTLVRRLSPAQLSGRRALPRPLVDGEALAGVVGDRLPGPGGLLLTVAAAAQATGEEDADADLVLRACDEAADGPLPELLARGEGRLRFRSALMARAVYATAPPGHRRAAHRVLAEAATGTHDAVLPLLHRSWAVAGPAPGLAAALTSAATDPAVTVPPALRRRALVRAAELTPDEAERARRHLAAAEQALLAGHAADALCLLDRARGRSVPASVRGGAELLRGAVLLADGPVEDARESFLLAAGLLAPTSPHAAARATLGAADASWSAGDPASCLSALAPAHTPPALPLATACVRVPRTPASADGPALRRGPSYLAQSPEGVGGTPAARAGAAAPHAARTARTAAAATPPAGDLARDHREGMRAVLLARFDLAAAPLRRVVEHGLHGSDPDPLLRSAAAALMLGDVPSARRAGARALAAARTSGSAALEPRALEYLAYAELRAGRHQLARTHAEEGLRTAERTGQRNTAAHHHAVLALAASIEGEADLVAEHAEAALRTARRHGLAQASTLAHWAAARADLGGGRPREAAQRLGPLVRPGARRGHFAVWMLAVPCFVEAAASAGRPQCAAAVVEDFALWAACGADPQAPAQLLRCRALLAAPDAADELYLRALDQHDAAADDFERARTGLLYGKWLRRRRRLREARTRLEEARMGFEHCGARLWAQQAAAELRAGGAAPPAAPAASSGAGELARLTPQQLRIARYVAEGATNREVALSLSVSTRTVDYHLRNVFATLGLRSRVELVRLVEQEEKTGARL